MYQNFFVKLFVVLVCTGLITSCEIFKGPDFSDVPSISFSEIKKTRITTAGALADSVTIIIKFRDGDGDLGITSEQREDPPFQENNSDGTPNRYHYNYFVKVFRKTNGVFNEVALPFTYSGAFLPLRTDGKEGPIEGDLEYGLASFFLSFTPPNDTLKFQIQIADRALHDSNTVETDEVVLNPK